MTKYLNYSMPADQVRICTRQQTCIEARGDNARLLVFAVMLILLSGAAYYLSKLK